MDLTPVGAPRPTSVTVFGILNIIFGLIGVLCTPFSLLSMSMPQPPGAAPNPMLDVMKNPSYRSIVLVTGGIGILASAVLLASGIGLLKERGWARKLAVGYGGYAVFSVFAGLFINYIFVVQPLMEAARQDNSPQANAAVVMAVVTVIASLLGLVFPVLLLVFMTRARVVAFFENKDGFGPRDFGPPTA